LFRSPHPKPSRAAGWIDFMTLFILSSAANLIVFVGYWAKDILWLRIISIGGLVCLFPYYYFQAEPLWIPMAWNVAYIALHFIRVFEIVRDRRPVDFTQEENALYLQVFDSLTPQQFKKILTIGRWRDFEPGHRIHSDGDPSVIEIAFLYGAAEARKKNRPVGSFGPGDLVGIGFIARNGQELFDLSASKPTRVMCWGHHELMKFLETEPELSGILQKIAGASLAPILIGLVEPENA